MFASAKAGLHKDNFSERRTLGKLSEETAFDSDNHRLQEQAAAVAGMNWMLPDE